MTTRISPTTAGVTIAALCVALATACGSVTATSSAGAGTTPPGSPASSSTSPSAASSPTGSSPTGSSSSTATCTPSQLTVAAGGSAAATGHSELVIAITNQGTATCTLSGFPAVAGTLKSGSVVHGADTTHVFIGMADPGAAPSPVTLAPGAKAWLPLNFTDTPVNGATSCPSFSSFAVTPPGVDRAYTVQAPDGSAGSPPDCNGIQVPPVLSAADAVIPSSS